MTLPGGTSTWATIDDLPDGVADLHQPAQWDRYLTLATDVLYSLSGRRWRGVERLATAELRSTPPPVGEPDRWAYHRSWGVCGCHGRSGFDPYPTGYARAHPEPFRVRLPHPDVTGVDAVTVDGVVFGAWRLEGAWLVRTDRRPWRVCGGVTVVAYRYGRPPPEGGVAACVELAAELGKAAAPEWDGECKLPQRVSSVARQGISFDVINPQDFLEDGKTGLYLTDLWLSAINPYRRAQEASVYSPDLARARRTS